MKQFWKKLLTYDEVIEVHIISGQYDLLAVLELDLREKPLFTTVKNLAQKAVRKIRKLGGVRDTNTFVPFLSVTKRVE
jgi:DNA-binding Lrp family transcriptional regulator